MAWQQPKVNWHTSPKAIEPADMNRIEGNILAVREQISIPLRVEVVDNFPPHTAGRIIYHTGNNRAYVSNGTEWLPIGIEGNAEAGHVLEGKTFSSQVAGAGAVGSMPDRGAVTITPGSNDISIPAGYHNGLGKVKAARLAISTKQAILVGSSFIVPMEQGYTFVEYPEVGNVEINTDNVGYIYLRASNGSADTASTSEVSIVTTSPIDLSMFSSVNIIWNTYSGTTGGTRYVGLAVSPTKIAPYSDRTAGVSRSYSATPNDYVKSTLDISSLTGEYYIRVHAYVRHTVGRNSQVYIAGIYLE